MLAYGDGRTERRGSRLSDLRWLLHYNCSHGSICQMEPAYSLLQAHPVVTGFLAGPARLQMWWEEGRVGTWGYSMVFFSLLEQNNEVERW